MAILFCSQCGKKVTDRMTVCPHCQATLIKITELKPEATPITKAEFKASFKDHLILTATALVLTLLVAWICSIIATIVMGRYIGMEAAGAVTYVRRAFFSNGLLVLMLEAVILGVLPVFFKGKSVLRLAVTLILAILFALFFRTFLPSVLLKEGKVEPILLACTRMVAPGFAFGFPALLGALTLAGFDRPLKTGIILQAGLCVVFLVLSVVLYLLMIILFGMGPGGLAMGNLLTALVVLLLSALTSKGFRTLITPKQLA